MKLNKIIFEWNQIEQDCLALANLIKEKNISYKGIVIISRGGLVIGAILSRILNIKLLDIMCITSYDHINNSKKEINILKNPDLSIKDNGKNWLILDDLIDSGDTYKTVNKILKEATFACLYNKSLQENYIKDIIFVKTYAKDSWLEFPWERIY